MLKDGDVIISRISFPVQNISVGDVGVIICSFTKPNETYEVEFLDDSGRTKSIVTMKPDEFEVYSN